jgi:hypothetical protein
MAMLQNFHAPTHNNLSKILFVILASKIWSHFCLVIIHFFFVKLVYLCIMCRVLEETAKENSRRPNYQEVGNSPLSNSALHEAYKISTYFLSGSLLPYNALSMAMLYGCSSSSMVAAPPG